jgi:tetratricopeptide (TPR) repeat protein
VRGDHAGAIREYENAIASNPTDPEPYIRIARIHRRELSEPDAALRWFKRARSEVVMGRGQELLVTQEIIELYRDDLATPSRAIPELARLIDRFPDDPAVPAARQELARLRSELTA